MEVFTNKTTPGDESAIKRGKIVPDGAVNLAFVKSPVMTPDKNVVIVDTSRLVNENIILQENTTKLYYSNALGMLVDATGNPVVDDEYPVISDEFNVAGDVSGIDLTDEDPLPFLHTSRYFHIDFVGLTLGGDQAPYVGNKIKVVDADGHPYVDDNGSPRYVIKIAPAFTLNASENQSAYRVLAYVDTDLNESLYLIYNKIELDTSGILKNEQINFQEILNPQRYYRYTPEESEVVDTVNRKRKIFSTKPINLKEQLLGIPSPAINGYKVYVPKKAVGDPRIFQLFRWRLTCEFIKNFEISTSTDLPINCGVIVTNTDPNSASGTVLGVIANSPVNQSNINLANPLNTGQSNIDKTSAAYWYVNFDTISNTDLAQFDALVWAPTKDFDFGPYLSKIDYFTSSLGRKLFIDTDSLVAVSNLDLTVSSPLAPYNGDISTQRTPGSSAIRHIDPYFDASTLGGWAINGAEPLSAYQGSYGNGTNVQYISASSSYKSLMDIQETHYQSITTTSVTDTVVQVNDMYTSTVPYSIFSDGVQVANNVWSVTVPTMPGGATFDRVELWCNRNFTANVGSHAVMYLNDAFGVSESSPVTEVGPSGIAATTLIFTNTDPAAVGEVFQSDFAVLDGGNFHITSGVMRATLFYHIDTTINNTHNVGLPHSVPITYQVPVTTTYPVTVSRGNLVFSTFGNLQSAVSGVAGAQEFIYNFLLYAAGNKKLYQINDQNYASNLFFSTNWQASWVINNPLAGDQVLTDDEKQRFNFVAQPKDLNDTEPFWQRRLSDSTCKELIDTSLPPDVLQNTAGLTRQYTLEVTNSQVETTNTLDDPIVPYAWTSAYTPHFVVPADLGTYVIQDENITAQLASGTYSYKIYPPKPYSAQARSLYLSASTMMTPQSTTWTAVGVATETYDVDITDPNQEIIQQTVVSTPVTETAQVELSWWNNSNRAFFQQTNLSYTGSQQPNGIALWSENNYYAAQWGSSRLNWPYNGMTGRYELGNSGEVPKFIQDFLNTLNYFTLAVNPSVGRYLLPGGALDIDGIYGAKTKTAVLALQQAFNCIYQDGIVDAETWAVIGAQILRWDMESKGATDYRRFYDYPKFHMQKQLISDGDSSTHFAKRSWTQGGPASIWDLIMVSFDQPYAIHAVGVIPFVDGNTPTIIVNTVDVKSQFLPVQLNGYDSTNAILTNLWHRVPDNTLDYIPLAFPIVADTIIIGLGQDGPAWDDSRMFGVRDIIAYAEVQQTRTVDTLRDSVITVPGITTVSKQARDIKITSSGTVSGIATDVDWVAQATPDYAGSGSLSNIIWESVTTDNANVIATVSTSGQVTLKNTLSVSQNGSGISYGTMLPSGSTYSMTTDGKRNVIPETGWISKSDGIKLLCDSSNNPIGFPAFPPSTPSDDTQRHYVNLTLTPYNTEASVHMAFYDINRQEFIVNDSGVSEIPYTEYIDRGPFNVYIAVLATLELDAQNTFSTQSDSTSIIPNLWAMPVYGVTTKSGSRITLEALPPNLGAEDVWPVAVRDGNFSRVYNVQTGQQLTTYLQGYAGTSVYAYYGIPEAQRGGWSTIYGVPNADVKGEEPLILDDNLIQVRQAPILEVQMPTMTPSDADPVRPIFTVWQKSNPNAAWVPLPWTEIQDYNTSTGEIYLKTPLAINDSSLLKVDYTTVRRHYYFKQYNSAMLNLNPYPGQSRSLLGKAVYIYILPEYVRDANGVLITASVQTQTLRFTTDPSVFNVSNPNYDPLAVELGVVYMSTALDINDLVILDTRRRGGGAKDSIANTNLIQLLNEASMYWDVNYGAGMLYQKGGFIIVRLPAALSNDFTEAQIRQVIDHNITAGVKYKLEDLNGVDWS